MKLFRNAIISLSDHTSAVEMGVFYAAHAVCSSRTRCSGMAFARFPWKRLHGAGCTLRKRNQLYRKDTPPFLILHGSADRTVPIIQSERFYDALHKNGIRSDFYVLEGAGHGEDCFYTDEIKERILLFLNEVLKNEKI